MATKSFGQALAEAAQLMNIEGVVGIGQGKADEKDCILVFVALKTPEIEKAIPLEYGGYPVSIEETGIIEAEKEQTNRFPKSHKTTG